MINGGTNIKCLKLKKGTRQEDPIATYLLILVLEIAFFYFKENKNIKGLNVFIIYSYTWAMLTIQPFF